MEDNRGLVFKWIEENRCICEQLKGCCDLAEELMVVLVQCEAMRKSGKLSTYFYQSAWNWCVTRVVKLSEDKEIVIYPEMLSASGKNLDDLTMVEVNICYNTLFNGIKSKMGRTVLRLKMLGHTFKDIGIILEMKKTTVYYHYDKAVSDMKYLYRSDGVCE